MNIILLSGGSGKRLWPLSNDVRSKQFIKLFKNDDEYESMVQRVYRQITTVDADAKITIATSKSQASAIKNQLGEKASICVEPCRRDTFPAIALAAAYLHDEMGVAENEAVVVCPVDPYVDNTYYEAVKTLQELAEQGGANLTLMGIEPTYPSEKYGYIIPESGENVSKVKEFKEKPDVENAKKYLAQSALWNAGIFAFKLGYLLDKAHSMIDFEDYRDLFNKYDTLTKISFDYAVVEKESSIQVLRYSGDWKDVGTWNMMAEVMADKTKGNASLILTDGKPLLWIANWYGTPIKEKISGSDLFPLLCEMAAEKGYKMFFLGAAEGVAAKAAENLMNRFKGLQVVGTYSPPFGFEKDPVEMDKIKSMIKEATPHILIVGLGCPKQEKFMYHHCAELGVPISFGLGASFDFEAGNIKRAPRWMANHGLEWLFRITQDPKRMAKRYLVDDRKILGLAIKYRK